MLFVGCWQLLHSTANVITRRSLLDTAKWRRPLQGQSVMVTIFLMENINIKILDRPNDDENGISNGPWLRYLVMTSTDVGKTLSKLSPFAIHMGVKGIAGAEVIIKRQFNGDIYLTCSKRSQSDNLLKCVCLAILLQFQ